MFEKLRNMLDAAELERREQGAIEDVINLTIQHESAPGGRRVRFAGAGDTIGFQRAGFRSLGAIDIDPEACADLEYLTGETATCADLAEMMPADLVDITGGERPDVIFTSPPCKASRLRWAVSGSSSPATATSGGVSASAMRCRPPPRRQLPRRARRPSHRRKMAG